MPELCDAAVKADRTLASVSDSSSGGRRNSGPCTTYLWKRERGGASKRAWCIGVHRLHEGGGLNGRGWLWPQW
jgi:hypothetical protein